MPPPRKRSERIARVPFCYLGLSLQQRAAERTESQSTKNTRKKNDWAYKLNVSDRHENRHTSDTDKRKLPLIDQTDDGPANKSSNTLDNSNRMMVSVADTKILQRKILRSESYPCKTIDLLRVFAQARCKCASLFVRDSRFYKFSCWRSKMIHIRCSCPCRKIRLEIQKSEQRGNRTRKGILCTYCPGGAWP